MKDKLIFIYNADSGLFNTVTDIAHKVFSPETYSCNLCALTHDYFNVRDEWKEFIAGLDVECEFLHRDEMQQRFPEMNIALPALLRQAEGAPEVCLSAEMINSYNDLDTLKKAILTSCIEGA